MDKGKIILKLEKSKDEYFIVTEKEYGDKIYIDLRLFYRPSEDAELVPTRKGLTIGLEIFKKFVDLAFRIGFVGERYEAVK